MGGVIATRTLRVMVDEADELYGLPDDEFTSTRDALAKQLRGEQRRDDADAVKALRRPSVAAAAINRAVREHGADDLLAAGEALRDAHEALLAGKGDARAVRDATTREREAVRDFARLALGDGASPSTEEKVRATLHAASVDDDVRELLVAGRLEREAEAGADPMAMLASGKSSRSAKKSGGSATKSAGSATKSSRSGGTKSGGSATKSGGSGGGKSGPSDAQRRREKAAERAQEAADRAVTAQAEAEAAGERARSTLDEAEEAARRARAVLEDLEGHERAARRAVKEAEAEAERRRTEARRAVKAAESRT
jgi:hypothetical protein